MALLHAAPYRQVNVDTRSHTSTEYPRQGQGGSVSEIPLHRFDARHLSTTAQAGMAPAKVILILVIHYKRLIILTHYYLDG